MTCPVPSCGQPQEQGSRALLAFSTNGEPDIVLYSDSGKLGAFERLPPGEGLRAMFRLSDTVEYHDCEQPPAEE